MMRGLSLGYAARRWASRGIRRGPEVPAPHAKWWKAKVPRASTILGIGGAGTIAGWVHTRRVLCVGAVATPSIRAPAVLSSKEIPPDRLEGLKLAELWELIRPDLAALIAAIAAAVGAAVVNVKLTRVLGDLVNAVTAAAGTMGASDTALRASAGAVLALAASQAACTFAYISLLSLVGERVCERMRNALFSAMIRQDVIFFDERKSGELMDRLTADVDAFRSAFKQVVSQGLRNATQATGAIISMFMVSQDLATGVSVLVPAIIAGGTVFGSILRQLSRQAKAATAEAHGVAGEVLANVRTVKSFAAEEYEEERFGSLTGRCRRLSTLLGVGIGAFAGLTHMFTNGLVLSVLYYGGQLMSRNKLSAGDLMAFLVSAQTIQRSFAHMSELMGSAMRGADAGARVFQYIRMKPSAVTNAGERPVNIQGSVEFRDVSFSYPTRPEQEILHELSLRIPAGKVVALCGPSGAGKSTIAGLIERFYDPSDGTVYVDGYRLKDLDTAWIRNEIGFINQEPVLFSGTVRDNIAYGRPDATRQEIELAARRANAHTFISKFPNGYDTVVGERGVTVSGGQKQRIAIARALVKDPKILVLDEATSALDAESEALVQGALNELSVGRTVVVIAHRLSTIRNADVIVVLNKGAIAEQGTHEQLVATGGIYANLVRQQMEGNKKP